MNNFMSMTPTAFEGFNKPLPLSGKSVFTGASQIPAEGGLFDNGKIFGMTPNEFSATAGGIGASISKPGSWQQRLGTLAKGMGAAQMQKIASEKHLKANQEFMTKWLDQDPVAKERFLRDMSKEPVPLWGPPKTETTSVGE
jgi:hypothetical protein